MLAFGDALREDAVILGVTYLDVDPVHHGKCTTVAARYIAVKLARRDKKWTAASNKGKCTAHRNPIDRARFEDHVL